ncbi:MAG: glutathione S-transferase family protein [Alphaproteobacteria bacterium]|nr:glutathione S-transferase family protein [Alphaproteobacteria bacterium]
MTELAVTVWGIGSTRTFRVHWTAAELGVRCDVQPIRSRTGETRTDTYGRVNPKRKIPTLQHDDFVLSESGAIMAYLTRVSPVPPGFFVPQCARAQARLDEWMSFASMELDAHTLYLLRRHRYLPEIYGEAPEACESAVEYFSVQIGAVADRVPAGDGYLLGDFSIADVLMTTIVDWAVAYDIDLPSRLVAYRDFTTRRPAYEAAYRVNYPERLDNGKTA